MRAKLGIRLTVIASLMGAVAAANAETKNKNIGEAIYMRGCVTCHGVNGEGAMPGIPDLAGDDGPLKKTDAELISNIMNGFESDAASMPMPPKGGDDVLTNSEAMLVLDYIRRAFQEPGENENNQSKKRGSR